MTMHDRTVMVTGAAGNLGRAVAAAFAEQGARLVLVGRRREDLARVFGEESPQRLHIGADLASQSDVASGVELAIGRFKTIDVLCNLAGGFRMGPPVHESGEVAGDDMYDVNVRTLLHAVHAVVPHMLLAGRGRIVNVGAASARKGLAGMGAYAAAKSTVHRLTESMAAELRAHRINVNCVLPTTIDTPQNRAAMPNADPSRWVAPADLANVIVFLASDQASAIHGALLPVAGMS